MLHLPIPCFDSEQGVFSPCSVPQYKENSAHLATSFIQCSVNEWTTTTDSLCGCRLVVLKEINPDGFYFPFISLQR